MCFLLTFCCLNQACNISAMRKCGGFPRQTGCNSNQKNDSLLKSLLRRKCHSGLDCSEAGAVSAADGAHCAVHRPKMPIPAEKTVCGSSARE